MRHTCLRLIVGLSWLWFTPGAKADSGSLSADYVANLFGYSGVMQQEDFSDAARRRNAGVIWSAQYSTPNDELAVTTITLAQGKTLLTDALRQQYDNMSAQQLKLPSGEQMPKTAQPIVLQNGATGFAHLAGFGPGGSAYEVVVTSPDQAFDLSISIAFSSSIDPSQAAKLQSYYDALAGKSGGGMLGLLQAAMGVVYPRIAEDYQGQSTTNAFVSPVALPATPPASDITASPTAVVAATNIARPEAKGGWTIPVIVGAILLIGLAWFARRPKRGSE